MSSLDMDLIGFLSEVDPRTGKTRLEEFYKENDQLQEWVQARQEVFDTMTRLALDAEAEDDKLEDRELNIEEALQRRNSQAAESTVMEALVQTEGAAGGPADGDLSEAAANFVLQLRGLGAEALALAEEAEALAALKESDSAPDEPPE